MAEGVLLALAALVGAGVGFCLAGLLIYFVLDPLSARYWGLCTFKRSERFRRDR